MVTILHTKPKQIILITNYNFNENLKVNHLLYMNIILLIINAYIGTYDYDLGLIDLKQNDGEGDGEYTTVGGGGIL